MTITTILQIREATFWGPFRAIHPQTIIHIVLYAPKKESTDGTTLKSDFENLICLCFRLLEKSVVQERFVQILDNAVLQALKEKGDVFKVFAFE